MAYHLGDAVFVGDTLFMPDYGTARADFPGGDARPAIPLDPPAPGAFLEVPGCSCATTTRRPAATTIAGRPPWATSVRTSVHVHDGVSEDRFVAMREERDAGAFGADGCCCRRSRSTSAPGASRPAGPDGKRLPAHTRSRIPRTGTATSGFWPLTPTRTASRSPTSSSRHHRGDRRARY